MTLKVDLATLFDHLPNGVTVQNMRGELIYANSAAAVMTGFKSASDMLNVPRETAVQKFELLDEDNNPFSLNNLPGRKVLKSGRAEEAVIKYRSIKGRAEHWSLVKATPVRNSDGKMEGAMSSFYDVTQQKRAEQILKLLNRVSDDLSSSLDYLDRLRILAQTVVPDLADGCAIDIVDKSGDLQRVAVYFFDPKKLQIAKKLQKAPIDRNSIHGIMHVIKTGRTEFYPEITVDQFAQSAIDVKYQALLRKLDIRSAVCIPLVARGRVLGAATFIYSESARTYSKSDVQILEQLAKRASLHLDSSKLFKESQKLVVELKEKEKMFRSIFETSLDAIILVDNKLQIIDANKSACSLFQLSLLQLITYNLSDLVVAQNLPELKKMKRKFLQPGSWRGEVEVIQSKEDSKFVEYSATSEFIRGLNMLIIRDISDRKYEERRQEHLLGIAGHELRSPLASIKAFVDIIRRNQEKSLTDPSVTRDSLVKIDSLTTNLAKLINDILDMTRIKSRKLQLFYEMFDFDKFIKDTIHDISITVPDHKIILKGKTGKDIVADKSRLNQVIINLIRNAIKYSPSSPRTIVNISQAQGVITFSVQDFGIGISQQDQRKVFTAYYRAGSARTSVRGLGVGLYIASEIVKAHKGKIWVKSELGQGSTFFVSLPLVPQKSK